MRLFSILILSLGLTTSTTAQERITPDEFLDFADGKTLTFSDVSSGSIVGIEEFLSRKLTVWKDRSLTCVYGEIRIESDQLCFYYDRDQDGLPACWWPFRDGDRLFVLLADLGNYQAQEVTNVTTETLDCPEIPAA